MACFCQLLKYIDELELCSMETHIINADKIVDGVGSLQNVEDQIVKLSQKKLKYTELFIDPLKTDWHSDLKKNHFRSGCGPIEAVIHADKLIKSKDCDFVVISGKDLIKSEYTREERIERMSIYEKSIPSLYNRIAMEYILKENISKDEFKISSDLLFKNYMRSYSAFYENYKPDQKWFKYITDLFRGVDCANPVVDFEGRLIIAGSHCISLFDTNSLKILGHGFGQVEDGSDNISEIKDFFHLEKAINDAIDSSKIDFFKKYINKKAAMEVYTCYPIIPLAFLFKSGLIKSTTEIPEFLKNNEITITGGMNLSKAPWNNPSLGAIIDMFNLLSKDNKKYGLIHGNGGLGYKQGILILEAT